MSAAWPGQVHRRAGREPGSCLAPRPGVSRAASDRSRRRRESPGGARARGGRLGSMSQQRPARKLPSPLMDPAEETMRRRCRDPINVESLLVSPADGLGPERRGPWRGVGRAGPVRSDRVASQAQPPLPFQGEAGLSVFGVGSPPLLPPGWAAAAPPSPLLWHCPLRTVSQTRHSLQLLLRATRTF